MHFLNLPRVSPSLDDIVVEFNPERQCCELRARKFRQGTEVQPIYAYANAIYRRTAGNKHSKCRDGDEGHFDFTILYRHVCCPPFEGEG